MTYEEIFKDKYSPAARAILIKKITTINNKNHTNPIDALCELYEDIVSEILNNAKIGLSSLAIDFCHAKKELTKKITNDIGKLPEKLTIYKSKNYLLDAYNDASNTPMLVESIYFDTLDEILNERNYYKEHIPRNAEEVFKKDVFISTQLDILYYVSDFKKYLNKNYSDHIKIKASDTTEQRRQIGQIINNIKNTNSTLTQQIKNIQDTQFEYNEAFKELNTKEELLISLLDLKNIESLTSQEKNSIEEKIQILKNNIESQKNKLSLAYIKCQKSINDYRSSQSYKAEKVKEFKKIDNLFITRLEALNNFVKEKIQSIAVSETKSIIEMNINQIRLHEISKYNIMYSTKLLEMYYYILFKHLLQIKDLLKTHTKSNNYQDILHINEEAKKILIKLSQEDRIIEEYSDISETILKVVIYYVFIKNETPDWTDKFSFWDDYIEFIKTCNQYSPIAVPKEVPDGFFSFTEFKERDKCNSQLEFTTQFNDYKEKFSSYEAKLLAHNSILTGITKLDEADFVLSIAKVLSFNEFRGVGGVKFIQLSNSTWIVVSTLAMAFKIKKYTNEEIMSYPAMHDIILNYETTFLQSYEIHLDFAGGREVPSNIYTSTSTYYYPEARITRLGNDKYGNKKVTNYQNYFKFWEDFYNGNKEIVKDPLYYDKSSNNVIDFSESNLFSAITKLFQNTLEQYADYSKQYMDSTGWLHVIATVLIPFYDILYKKFTDDSYTLNKTDYVSLVIDGITVAVALVAAGIVIVEKTMTSILSSIAKAKKTGIIGRKNLLIYVARNASELPQEIITILIKAAFELVSPIPFLSLSNKFPKIVKSFKKSLVTSSLNVGANYKHLNRLGELNPEWAVKDRIVDLTANKRRNDGYYKNVYELSHENSYSLQDKDYYIKSGYDIYQVEWDDYCHTWRVIDQRNTVDYGYKTPVKWGNFANKWVTHSFVPGLGGAPITTANFVEITEEEAQPIVDLIEEGRVEALNRITVVKNELLNLRDENKQYIHKAFNIFLGTFNSSNIQQFKVFLNKQEEVLKNLSIDKDIRYYGGFDNVSARSVFTTNAYSYYNEKLLSKPFLNAYINPIIDTCDVFKFTKDEFKEYLSTVLMHEIHHATRNANVTNDLAYEEIFELDDGSGQGDVSRLVELAVPHLRLLDSSIVIDNKYLLEEYSYLDKNIEKLLDAKNTPGANIKSINQQLHNIFKSMIEKSDKTVFTNPDNVAFLVNLIYDLIKNKPKFISFIESYNAWFNEPMNPIIWNYRSSNRKDVPLYLENSVVGKINRGFLDPITSITKTYYIDNASNIETNFTYVISDISTSNIVSTEIATTDNLYSDILTTCKGSDIKTQRITDELKIFEGNTFKNNINSFENINFINISNNKNCAIGIKIKKSDIIYGYPVLVYNQYKGIFTLVCANKGDYFYIYYCPKPLIVSMNHILKINNELYSGGLETFRALSTPYIDNFLIHLGNRYERVIIHYSDLDLDSISKEKLSQVALPNTNLHQYDKIIDTHNNYIAIGQAYVLITKSLIGKPKATSNSYSTLIRKENEKLIFSNVSDYSISYEF